jgi:hypothetical protein
MTDDTNAAEITLPPSTAPDNYSITTHGCGTEESQEIANVLFDIIIELGRYMDLERLDGITIAADYAAALSQLDRGFKAQTPLAPTEVHGTGVAMTPMVIRDGIVKSHIVFDLAILRQIVDFQGEHWQLVFQIVAHECAHVHDHKVWDVTFPNILLNQKYTDIEASFLWQIAHACWSEYAATRLSAKMGVDQTAAYEETFITALSATRERANTFIRAYRMHGNHTQILAEVCGEYGNLMKFASYLIGHLAGSENQLSAAPKAQEALSDHWFASFFERLQKCLQALWEHYGTWSSLSDFETVGLIAKELIADGGVYISRLPSNEVKVVVPSSAETIP